MFSCVNVIGFNLKTEFIMGGLCTHAFSGNEELDLHHDQSDFYLRN